VIVAYAKTSAVSTRCRLCGKRNPADMPVVCVDNPLTMKIVRRYYCMPCYNALIEAAQTEIPNLMKMTGVQSAHVLSTLLGVVKPTVETKVSADRMLQIDVELYFPEEFVLNRVPFERFYERARQATS
jgi:hypothetical protein